MRTVFLLLCVGLGGCALAPNSIRPEVEHLSHLSQHFGDSTDYGANVASVIAHWDLQHAYVEVGEGTNLGPHWSTTNSWGEIIGPREEFSARVGYIIQVK